MLLFVASFESGAWELDLEDDSDSSNAEVDSLELEDLPLVENSSDDDESAPSSDSKSIELNETFWDDIADEKKQPAPISSQSNGDAGGKRPKNQSRREKIIRGSLVALVLIAAVIGLVIWSANVRDNRVRNVVDNDPPRLNAVAPQAGKAKSRSNETRPPSSPEISLIEKAKLAYGRKEYQQADHFLTLHINQNGGNASEYILRGHCRYETGKISTAITDYNRAVELDSTSVAAHLKLSEMYELNDEYSKVIREYSKLIELEPGEGKWYEKRGDLFQRQRLHEKAINDFTDSIAKDPDGDYLRYKKRGMSHKSRKNYDKAISDFSVVLSQDPNDYESYKWRGLCCIGLKKYPQAYDDLTFLIINEKQLDFAYKYRGVYYYRLQQYDDALQDYLRALSYDPKSGRERGRTHKLLYLTYKELGASQSAIFHLRKSKENGYKK